ncbi:hypothetical protein HNO86_17440 [Pseudomonas sp. C1C7]|uniref:hypothetical protein n=1 Tax=Pseudomonas sp. C1C7 TaxID=2735272 RepID=UPI001585DC85|nr:hypothetical protein [Pseudomonas sp. C1C7]NUT76827.1 hypothetical protein [Pseudomonas sp. C1C7]
MAAIDVEQLVTDIKAAANLIINQDIATVKGFSERQLKAIGVQAKLVADGIVTGEITEETREFFLEGIENMTTNFLETLKGLFQITIEKLWNAVVSVVWSAINGAVGVTAGLVLPVPTKV